MMNFGICVSLGVKIILRRTGVFRHCRIRTVASIRSSLIRLQPAWPQPWTRRCGHLTEPSPDMNRESFGPRGVNP